MAATTSTNCSGFFSLRSNSVEPRVRTTSSHGSSPGCGKLDGAAPLAGEGQGRARGVLEHLTSIEFLREVALANLKIKNVHSGKLWGFRMCEAGLLALFVLGKAGKW
ncbi:hypothetical protein SADUNF_Sadunf14G0005400 [Salix dunnii]|uniref:Uncharacterized protein n=1 Tax=Salix dunnii TaxID=1413687 RepID=A0A835JJW0_9ROSI|nr:hypothetical protein SADUNF_Sadunf14G0005400 [Salix dunnii]